MRMIRRARRSAPCPSPRRTLLLCALAWVAAPAQAGPPELSTTLDLEWAVDASSGDAQTLGLRLEPELELPLPRSFRLGAIGRLRADAYDRLEPGRPSQAEIAPATRRLEIGDRVELELRELFVEGRIGGAWLRLGKQQVVWGQADGLKVLDLVDPQSFREFILPEFEDSRIPLWTANLEVPVGAGTLQLLFVPDPTTHDVPEPDALYAFTAPRLIGPSPPPGLRVDLREADRPEGMLRAADAGARLSGRLGGWDLTANYLWHFDDRPVLRRALDLSRPVPTVVATPVYRRAHVVGATASNAFGDLTLRLETALTTPIHLPTARFADADGIVQSDELAAVVGLDWYGFDDTLLSAQVFPSWLLRDAPGLLRDRFDTMLTLLARRTFRNERLVLEAIWLQSLAQGDGLLRPKIRYELRGDLSVYVGFDWFYGTREGVFGEFDARDRVVLGCEWGI
jgi:hypothetical protein